MFAKKANVKQAVAYLAALGIKVTGSPIFNGDGEITFVCLHNSRELLSVLNAHATPVVEYGYHTYRCGPGKLTVEPLGALGCAVTLSNE